jgi:hypothetical protein
VTDGICIDTELLLVHEEDDGGDVGLGLGDFAWASGKGREGQKRPKSDRKLPFF